MSAPRITLGAPGLDFETWESTKLNPASFYLEPIGNSEYPGRRPLRLALRIIPLRSVRSNSAGRVREVSMRNQRPTPSPISVQLWSDIKKDTWLSKQENVSVPRTAKLS
jgi:hypothetical protein